MRQFMHHEPGPNWLVTVADEIGDMRDVNAFFQSLAISIRHKHSPSVGQQWGDIDPPVIRLESDPTKS